MSNNRLADVRVRLSELGVSALFLTDLFNIRYMSGFTGSTAVVLVTRDRAIIFVDSRYVLQAGLECPGFEVVHFAGEVFKKVAEVLGEIKPSRVGFESDNLTVARHKTLRSLLAKEIRLVATARAIETLRLVKEPEEVENIRRAAKLVDDCFSYIIGYIRPGLTEREVALEIDTYLRRHGAEKQGFDTIAAAGPNAAYPHHKPTDAVLKAGQMLKLDYGALLDGYNSDITRTVFLGEPDEKGREVYDVVLQAQVAAIEAIRPGMMGKEIDEVARESIRSRGYGDYFGHGLGHSLGIDVHDGPGLTPTSELILIPGMVMTVEPGVYIEGWGGVRIEDDVVVTDTGAEILTHSTKKLVSIR